MAEAATLALPYPEAAEVAEDTLASQSLAVALDLPERPLVLGGCCCAHIGAVEGLAARVGRISLVWLDAHGDLNTRESSPSGNEWGMPLRMLIDSAAVRPDDVALVGARNLDPPEVDFIEMHGLRTDVDGIEHALTGTDGVYVALDFDALDASEVAPFMPEPGGISVADAEQILRAIRERISVLGAGLSGLAHDDRNVQPAARLCTALGL